MAKNPHYLSQLVHIEIYSPDVEKSVHFLRDVVGLDETGRDDTSVYFRAWGDYFHHTLKVTTAKPTAWVTSAGGPIAPKHSTNA